MWADDDVNRSIDPVEEVLEKEKFKLAAGGLDRLSLSFSDPNEIRNVDIKTYTLIGENNYRKGFKKSILKTIDMDLKPCFILIVIMYRFEYNSFLIKFNENVC